MSDEHDPPTTVRDGSRIWIDTPLDSPYATRLRRFGAHWDFASTRWWVGVAKANALDHLLTLPLGSAQDNEPEPEPQRSAAALLVDMACDHYTFGATETGDPYGTHRDIPHVALMLRGGKAGLRAELARRYWDACSVPAPQQAIADACAVLEGLGTQEEPKRVDLRVAEHDGAVYIDMGDADGHVIEISAGTWDIGIRAPILFRRTKLTGPLPKPYADGDYSRLWEFVPIGEDDRPLVLAWLVQTLIHPNTAHPVLALFAEHGSGKTSATKCLVALTDPSAVPVRKAPRDADGWVTAAYASWVVALDNLSGEIPLWLSDSLCRAVTGEGDVRRALYTDQDVSIMSFRRAIIITGVDVEVTQGDLADRLLPVELPRMAARLGDEELVEAWADEYPSILGGLLTLAAQVHHRLTSITVPDLPRMADYARVLTVVDEFLGTQGLARYREQAKRSAADTLDSPFIAALLDRCYTCRDKTSKDILRDLTPVDDKWKAPKGWPGNARAVTGQLTRHGPALRSQDWTVEHDDAQNKDGVLRWFIQPPEKDGNPSPPSPPSPPEDDNQWSDGLWDGGLEDREESDDDPPDPTSNPPSPPSPPSQPDYTSLTSDDGAAGQAGHEYRPSLVLCQRCGNEMMSPQSISRGYCERCHLAAKRGES